MTEDYIKQKIAIRYWMLGKGYITAVKAMDFAEVFHDGVRKDGSPEFSHQVSQANYARSMAGSMSNPEETLAVIFLHDIMEDHGVTHKRLKELFGKRIADAVHRMTKEFGGVKTPNTDYYEVMLDDEIAILAKGFDRVHNLMTMLGGFSVEKRIEYIKETEEFVIPALKQARRKYPAEEVVYENIKFVMTNQIQLYKALNEEPPGS